MHTRKYALGRIRCHCLPVLPLSPHRLLSPVIHGRETEREAETVTRVPPPPLRPFHTQLHDRAAASRRQWLACARPWRQRMIARPRRDGSGSPAHGHGGSACSAPYEACCHKRPQPAYAPADEAGPAATAMKMLSPKPGKGGKIRPLRTPSRRRSASSRPQSSSSSPGYAPRTSWCWPTSSRARSWWARTPP
jgi:hypothetical protein